MKLTKAALLEMLQAELIKLDTEIKECQSKGDYEYRYGHSEADAQYWYNKAVLAGERSIHHKAMMRLIGSTFED